MLTYLGIPIDGYRLQSTKSYLSKRYATCRQVRTQVNWREIYRENTMLQMQHSNVTFLIGRKSEFKYDRKFSTQLNAKLALFSFIKSMDYLKSVFG